MSDIEKHINPSHYKAHPSGVECIDIIEEFPLNIGTAIKYLWRAGLKEQNPAMQDLHKARWFVEREIVRLTKKAEKARLKVPQN